MQFEKDMMKARNIVMSAIVLALLGSSYAWAHSPGIKPELKEPQEVIRIYLKAVERGELIIFERKLEKSMLTPIRIEYVYELNNTIVKVKVYSELKKPMPVPGQNRCKLRGVSAILDRDGKIVETEAHIWTE